MPRGDWTARGRRVPADGVRISQHITAIRAVYRVRLWTGSAAIHRSAGGSGRDVPAVLPWMCARVPSASRSPPGRRDGLRPRCARMAAGSPRSGRASPTGAGRRRPGPMHCRVRRPRRRTPGARPAVPGCAPDLRAGPGSDRHRRPDVTGQRGGAGGPRGSLRRLVRPLGCEGRRAVRGAHVLHAVTGPGAQATRHSPTCCRRARRSSRDLL